MRTGEADGGGCGLRPAERAVISHLVSGYRPLGVLENVEPGR